MDHKTTRAAQLQSPFGIACVARAEHSIRVLTSAMYLELLQLLAAGGCLQVRQGASACSTVLTTRQNVIAAVMPSPVQRNIEGKLGEMQ